MGRRGPAPQPTELKVLNGNPGKRPLPKAEPKPPAIEPEMPGWLDAEASKEWTRIVPILLRMKVLTEADGTALATYCEAVSTYAEASRVLQRDGFAFLNEKTGVEHARPEVSIVQQCRVIIKAFCQEFGMTPSSRSRMVMVVPEREKSKMEDLLNYRK